MDHKRDYRAPLLARVNGVGRQQQPEGHTPLVTMQVAKYNIAIAVLSEEHRDEVNRNTTFSE